MTNIVILNGNLGADPEVRTTGNGNRVANFSLATSRPRYADGNIVRDENGRAEQDTEWHRVAAFNGQAKSAEKCVKGMKVLVIGRNKTSKWTDKDGVTRYTTEVIAEKIEFQAWPKRSNDGGGANDPDDEIPF